MANTFAVSRAQLVYALCLPLAVLVGYFLGNPVETGNLGVVVLVVTLLSIPLLMRWHHPLLALAWNAMVMPYFLPGRPYLWMLMAMVALFFGVLNRFTNPDARFVIIPSLNRSLLAFAAVVVITGAMRGGLGLRFFGSAHYGGRNYLFVLTAVAGYFAFASQRIPLHRANLYLAFFFLPGFVALVPNLAYYAGGRLDFLFYVLPAELVAEQARADYVLDTQFARIYGLTLASIALYCWALARYGIRGALDYKRPWRAGLLLLAVGGCLFSGFRSSLVLFGVVFVVQMYCEGLFRPRVLLLGGLAAVIAGLLILPQADRLPLVMQRTLSFLPVQINPAVRQGAEHSSQWRLDMWHAALAEVPTYLLRGKGYGFDPIEIEFATENTRRGYAEGFATAIIAGDYHSGPLSVLIPFGIWGVLAFGWFIVAALRYLHQNYRQGNPALRQINLFLFAYFIARLVVFLFVFGALNYEFFIFTGLLGFSASLNGAGVPQPAAAEQTEPGVAYREEFASENLR